MPMQRIKLPISGMSCAACAYRIEQALTTAEGVTDVHVSRTPSYASVRFDPTQINLISLVKRVYNEGYGVPQAAMELYIVGVIDDAEFSVLEEALRNQTGILSVEVSKEKVDIAYVPGVVQRSDIVKAVEEAGYSIREEAGDPQHKGWISTLAALFLKLRK